jgi:hypothetical protein
MHLMVATGEAMRVTVRDVAGEIAASLGAEDRQRGLAEARRLAFSLVERFDRSTVADRQLLVADRPDTTGDTGFDALLAAIVEHVCTTASVAVPAWADEPSRFLDTWWFVSGLRSLHADALVHTPISFARRGVFITGDALTYA